MLEIYSIIAIEGKLPLEPAPHPPLKKPPSKVQLFFLIFFYLFLFSHAHLIVNTGERSRGRKGGGRDMGNEREEERASAEGQLLISP